MCYLVSLWAYCWLLNLCVLKSTFFWILRGRAVLSLLPSPAFLLHYLPQPTALLFGLGRDRRLMQCDVTPHTCILPALAAPEALTQRRTLAQELFLASAPHLVQVNGSFPLTKASGCCCSTTGNGKIVQFPYLFNQSAPSFMDVNINLCPSCLHTTAAFRSFHPESQILPQSPWR